LTTLGVKFINTEYENRSSFSFALPLFWRAKISFDKIAGNSTIPIAYTQENEQWDIHTREAITA